MSGGGYTPLFSSIVLSTIWREDNETRLVWITMLALADARGIIEASIPGLADAARVPIDKCKDALKTLMSPDEYSRTKDHDGRRIEEVDGGWRLLNIAKFRDKCRNRADYMRDYMRDKRVSKPETAPAEQSEPAQPAQPVPPPEPVNLLAGVSRCLPPFTDSDKDSYTDKDKDKEEAAEEERKPSAAAGEGGKPEAGKYGKWIGRLKTVRPDFRATKDFSWHAVMASTAVNRTDMIEIAVTEFEGNVANEVNYKGNPVKHFHGYLVKTMKKHMKPSELYEHMKLHKIDRSMFASKESK